MCIDLYTHMYQYIRVCVCACMYTKQFHKQIKSNPWTSVANQLHCTSIYYNCSSFSIAVFYYNLTQGRCVRVSVLKHL